jgi:hypothetical protein
MKRNVVTLTPVLLAAFAQSVLAQSAIETALAATVTIEVTGPDGESGGSGFITSSEGMIVTAAHVIEGATSAVVRLQNGEELEVEGVIVIDRARDFAIVRVAGFDLPTVPLGNADNLTVGQRVIAIGSPLGLEATVSDGLVAAERMVDGTRIIQISVPLSPGSSGGPVMTEQGEVIGLVVSGIVGGDSQNLNFALPINYVRGQLSLAETRPLQPLAAIQETDRPRVAVRSRDRPSTVPSAGRPTQSQPIPVNPFPAHKKISGIGLASTWALTALVSAMMEDDMIGTTILPVMGPWVTMARTEGNPLYRYHVGAKQLLVASGLLQGGFLVYFLTSYVRGKSFSSGFTVSPMLNSRGSGIALKYRF